MKRSVLNEEGIRERERCTERTMHRQSNAEQNSWGRPKHLETSRVHAQTSLICYICKLPCRQATACTGEPPKEPGTMPVGRRRDVISWTSARKNRRASTARAHARPACACARETDMRVRMRGRDLLHSDSSFRHIPKQIHHNPELIFWLSFTTGAESRRVFFPCPGDFFS